jgi:hypothetical protein
MMSAAETRAVHHKLIPDLVARAAVADGAGELSAAEVAELLRLLRLAADQLRSVTGAERQTVLDLVRAAGETDPARLERWGGRPGLLDALRAAVPGSREEYLRPATGNRPGSEQGRSTAEAVAVGAY